MTTHSPLSCLFVIILLITSPFTLAAQNRTVYDLISRDYWTGRSGTSVADIPLGNKPTDSDTLTKLEAVDWTTPTTTQNWADNYGERIMGWLTAPTAGTYYFWIAGSNDCELWMTTSGPEVKDKVLIANVTGGVTQYQWNAQGNQKSSGITLAANRMYYFEVLHKAGVGDDHCAVGWARPGEGTATPSEIIPGNVLSPRPRMKMGQNTSWVSYWSECWFVDIFKGSEPWMEQALDGGPNIDWDDIPMDAQGYPLEVPFNVGGYNYQVETFVPGPEYGTATAGQYVVLWDGDGDIEAGLGLSYVSGGNGRMIANLSTGLPVLRITRSENADHVRNIRCVPIANESTYLTEPYRQDFMQALGQYRCIRWMGALATNGMGATTWSTRKKPDDQTQNGADWTDSDPAAREMAFGVAYEYIIDFCNQVDADIWVTLPHMATVDYFKKAAILFRSGYDMGSVDVSGTEGVDWNLGQGTQVCDPVEHKIYVEYSNECWNWGFTQAQWVLNDPTLVGLYGADNHPEKYAYKHVEMANEWEAVFTGADRQRIVTVAGCQLGWTDTCNRIIDECEVLGNLPDALSPSCYFGLDDAGRTVLDGLGASATADDVMDEVERARQSQEALGTEECISYAQSKGVGFVCYEGGQHLTDYNTYSYSPALVAAKDSPRMYAEYIRNFNWQEKFNCEVIVLLVAFGDSSEPGGFGHFLSVDSQLNDYDNPLNLRGRAAFDSMLPLYPEDLVLSITTNSPLPGGEENMPYSATLEAANGSTPYAWSIAAGSLPAGLGLDTATGGISGTPTADGDFTFTAQVTDFLSDVATRELSLHIDPYIDSTPVITTASLPDGAVNGAYSETLLATGGNGTLTWTLASGSLPNGLSLSTDGIISGMPTAEGVSSFTVQVEDVDVDIDTQALTITVNPEVITGSITRQRWDSLSGTAVADLTGAPAYPDSPDYEDVLTVEFDSWLDVAEDYGQRVHGFVHPPVTASDYIFWICSDDASELNLSTDADPANKTQIAYISGWADYQNWTDEANQRSDNVVGLISLQAGQKYYIEALMKEGSGGDNLTVAWASATAGIASTTVIPCTYLSPWADPPDGDPSGLTATENGSDQIDLSWTDGSTNEAIFIIERSLDGVAGWALVGTVGADVTSHSDTGLDEGTIYYYRVKARNAGGDSGYSAVANATTDPAGPPPNYVIQVTPAAADLTFGFDTLTGKTYTLMRNDTTPDLSAAGWVDAGETPIAGDGTPKFFTVPKPASGSVFYTIEYEE